MKEPILLTPGPLTTSTATKLAMVRDWGSRDAGFIDLNRRVRQLLLKIIDSEKTHVCVPLQGSGTFAVEAMLGTMVPENGHVLVPLNGAYGRAYMDASTENVLAGSAELWQIANLSADTHPIHFHLVNAQVISRQAFAGYRNGVPNLTGAPLPPPPFERGWKETVRMNPGEVTTVIIQFNLATVPNVVVPLSPRTGGHEFVWHCHILEHEEHDMMRPLVVS